MEDEVGTEPADTEGEAGEDGDTGAELDDGTAPCMPQFIIKPCYGSRVLLCKANLVRADLYMWELSADERGKQD